MNKSIGILKNALHKNKIKRNLKKSTRKAARKNKLLKLQGHLKSFIEAAFEPKSIKKARKQQKKMEQ